MPKILLVEDEEGNAEIVMRFLKNYEVIRAVNGPEAVAYCAKERPDLILMDMALPCHGDGQKATMEIRSLPGMQTVPIIALTATCLPEKVAEMYKAGCNDIVTKPFERTNLLAKTAAFLGQETKT